MSQACRADISDVATFSSLLSPGIRVLVFNMLAYWDKWLWIYIVFYKYFAIKRLKLVKNKVISNYWVQPIARYFNITWHYVTLK